MASILEPCLPIFALGGGNVTKNNPRSQPLPHEFVTVYLRGRTDGFVLKVRLASRSIPPRWGSIRFRLALRTYAPCGPSVRVVSQTKSRKIPTRKVLPLFFVLQGGDATTGTLATMY